MLRGVASHQFCHFLQFLLKRRVDAFGHQVCFDLAPLRRHAWSDCTECSHRECGDKTNSHCCILCGINDACEFCLPIPITIALQPSPSVRRQEDSMKQSAVFDFFTSFGSPVRPDSLEATSLLSSMTQSAVIMSPVCKIVRQIPVSYIDNVVIKGKFESPAGRKYLRRQSQMG